MKHRLTVIRRGRAVFVNVGDIIIVTTYRKKSNKFLAKNKFNLSAY